MADGDLRKAHVTGNGSGSTFVVGESPGMEEHDGHRCGAGFLNGRQCGAHFPFVERRLHRAVRQHAFVDLGDAGIELFGQDDLLGEDIRSRLIADPQRVAVTLRDKKRGRVALAFEKCVGGHGGAHLDRADETGGNGSTGLDTEQAANALHGCVSVAFRVFRQQLVGVQRSVRRTAYQVRECTAPVDPEIPRRH